MTFDNVSHARAQSRLMSSRRVTVSLRLVLVAALATSALASCMAGPAMTADTQMACCKAGQHECGTRKAPDECCKTDSQTQQQLIVAKDLLVRSPRTLVDRVSAVVPGDLVTVAPTAAIKTDLRVLPKSPSPQTHLLISALRI